MKYYIVKWKDGENETFKSYHYKHEVKDFIRRKCRYHWRLCELDVKRKDLQCNCKEKSIYKIEETVIQKGKD